MMKKWYLFVIIFMFVGCNHDEIEKVYEEITIEKTYPYFYEKKLLHETDSDTLGIFKQKIYLINSIAQLNENSLFTYSSDDLKDELSKCDFEKYTLVITSSIFLHEIVELKYNFGYNKYQSEFQCNQTFYSKPLEEPIESFYFIINAFLINKIPDNSNVILTTALIGI